MVVQGEEAKPPLCWRAMQQARLQPWSHCPGRRGCYITMRIWGRGWRHTSELSMVEEWGQGVSGSCHGPAKG